MKRRDILRHSLQLTLIAASARFITSNARAATDGGRYAAAFARLDAFAESYMREMNAPGMTLSLADADGTQRICAYGFEDAARRTPVDPGRLFHIGSISKSFAGLCALQLHEEGKLDLRKPIHHYLPWLRFDAATRPLSTHDLLTHAAALPDGPLFPADPAFRHRPTAAPGTFFHYCNMGYEAVGHLLVALDQKPLPEVLRARILAPLGMTGTEPVITLDAADRMASSYAAGLNDRPYPRQGSLIPAAPIAMSGASGCIASTAHDMGAYLTMLIRHGRTPSGRLLSEAGFEAFATPHIAAAEFGEGASYGYGIAVDTLDGHKRVRHTGGMVSFASALEVDLEAGVGAFASINAMQGYRPRPVAEYALRLMRAVREGAPLPDPPSLRPSWRVEHAADYAGQFTEVLGADPAAGPGLNVVADGERLYLAQGGERIALEPEDGTPDAFTVLHPQWSTFTLLFGRAGNDGKGDVVEVAWGDRWFVSSRHSGPRQFTVPAPWRQYPGHYRNEDPWIGSHHIVLRKGRLWLNGVTPLEASKDGRFFLRDEPQSPEWVRFSDIANGAAQRLTLSGADLWRTV
jgi:CubicO group peptidase (beta-lactamase class C family)